MTHMTLYATNQIVKIAEHEKLNIIFSCNNRQRRDVVLINAQFYIVHSEIHDSNVHVMSCEARNDLADCIAQCFASTVIDMTDDIYENDDKHQIDDQFAICAKIAKYTSEALDLASYV